LVELNACAVYLVAPATALQVTIAVPVPAAPDLTVPPVGALWGATPAKIGAATYIEIVAVADFVPSVAVIVNGVVASEEVGVPEIRPEVVSKVSPAGSVPPEIAYPVGVKFDGLNDDV
jgi:hypothetical protein